MTKKPATRVPLKNRLLGGLIWCLSLMPLRMARALGWLVGELAWLLKTRGTQTAMINLAFCFPDMPQPEQQRLCRASMRQWGQTVLEVPVIWRLGRRALARITAIEGETIFDEAMAAGKGVILVAPHLGNWEVVGYWLAGKGPANLLYQPPREPGLEEVIMRGRTALGAKLVATDLRGVSSLIKGLKNGEIAGILPDMEPDASSGEFAPIFGRQAMTITLVNRLQQKSGAKVVFAFAERVPSGFALHIMAPEAAIYGDDAQEALAAVNRGVERLVMIAPAQYQWEYKRFKRRPAGEPRIYP